MSSQDQDSSSSQLFRWHYDEFDDSNFQIHGRTLFFIVVLFSIILLITLLFIYTRWLCRVVPPPPSPTPSSSSSSAPAPPHGLDMATVSKMPTVMYDAKSSSSSKDVIGDGSECSICLGLFGDKEVVKMLPGCRHCFHSECVDKWLLAHSTCPLCRASLLRLLVLQAEVDSPV